MRKLLFFTFLFFTIHTQSQTYIKGNAATALGLIPNLGIETSIGHKMTFQFDVLASFWKSIDRKPYEFYTFTPEIRYHFNEKFNGFYVGGHLGFDVFNVTKWNYIKLGIHQVGVGYNMGATIGYQKKISDNFVLDFFIGGGNHQGFYHSYYIETGERYEYDKSVSRNKSGEWLLYRGGVMLSYRFH